MPEQLTFLEPPQPTKAVPAWETLNAEQRTAIHALLARMCPNHNTRSHPFNPEQVDMSLIPVNCRVGRKTIPTLPGG